MKKQIFGLMALILCACAGLTACSDDDDDDNNGIVGLWEQTHFLEWGEDYSDGPYNPEAWKEEGGFRLEFTSDGKMIQYSFEKGQWILHKDEIEQTYTVSDNKLIVTSYDKEENERYTETESIDEINSNTLIITERDYDPGLCIYRYKFRRVK